MNLFSGPYKYENKNFNRLKKIMMPLSKKDAIRKRFFYCLEKQIIFIHVPKCAGTALNNTLYGTAGFGHTSPLVLERYFSYEELSRCKFIVLTRDPILRFLSTYNYLKNGGMNIRDKKLKKMHSLKLNDFVEKKRFKNLFGFIDFLYYPQTTFLAGIERYNFRLFDCDDIEVWDKISEFLGMKVRPKLMNATNYIDQEISQKSREIIIREYQKDYDQITKMQHFS